VLQREDERSGVERARWEGTGIVGIRHLELRRRLHTRLLGVSARNLYGVRRDVDPDDLRSASGKSTGQRTGTTADVENTTTG
jgi:hypothetical protein